MLWSFLFLNKNICCGYSLEVPRRGAFNEYPQHMFSSRNKKNIMWIPPLICCYASNFRSWGPGFESHWRRNPAHYYMPLNCTEPFIITLPSSRYDLSDVERDGKHQIIIIVSSRAFLLRGQDILSRFSAIFYKETTLMTSSLLFWTGSTLKFFPFEEDHVLEVSQKQFWQELPPL